MIKGQGGGANTGTGLSFQSRHFIETAVRTRPSEYTVFAENVYTASRVRPTRLVGKFLGQHLLYQRLLEPKNIDFREFVSKKLLPDEALLVGRTLRIVEVKFQERAGSVDEKLETCAFKLKQYTKLLSSLSIKVKYAYVLNDWFRQEKYADVLTISDPSGATTSSTRFRLSSSDCDRCAAQTEGIILGAR